MNMRRGGQELPRRFGWVQGGKMFQNKVKTNVNAWAQLNSEHKRLSYYGGTKQEWLKLADLYDASGFPTNAKKCRVEAAKVKDV